ncbi:GNAT family N-acetyltransferase [Nocardioides litoris]|uniref:GNAT family N-acetyltransferase n=1 Tax=Nocardioides litoris TaxID=1926648 RepID=UPI0011201890|nr:GNAT family N-acetyltransferase [Nocardioides litoris]
MDLRPAVPDDAEAFVALHQACWHEAYADLVAPEVFAEVFGAPVAERVAHRRAVLARPELRTWVADDAGLVGFATSGPPRLDVPPVDLELYAIYLRAAHWGSGLADALLDAVVADRPAYLWVLEGNDRATRFYERRGFAPDGAAVEDRHRAGRELRMVRRPA